MKKIISKFYANILNIWYNGYVLYSHINANGYWEYAIVDIEYGIVTDVLYKTKGYKE